MHIYTATICLVSFVKQKTMEEAQTQLMVTLVEANVFRYSKTLIMLSCYSYAFLTFIVRLQIVQQQVETLVTIHSQK